MPRSSPSRLVAAVFVALVLGTLSAPAARADSPTLVVDWPSDGVAVGASVAITGWAVAPAAERGTGIDAVRAYLDGPIGDGAPVGQSIYGVTRSDVALALREARYGAAGWRIDADLPPGSRALFVYAHLADQPDDQGWTGPVQVTVRVESGAFTSGIASERPAPALAPAPASGACASRDSTAAACAASPAATNNCAVPDRDSGRCLVRAGSATSRGPTAMVPGSWTAADPAGGTSASNSGASGGGTPSRLGYPVAASGAGDRPSADAASASAPGPSSGTGAAASAPSPSTASAAPAARSGSGSLSLSVASMGGRQVQLNWNAFTAGSPVTYEVWRCATLNSAASTCGVVASVQGGGYRISQSDGFYFVRAVGPQGQVNGESNRVQLNRG